MSATSQKSPLSGAKDGRIGRRKTINVRGETDSEGGWIPSLFSQSQYLQVDIGKKVKITAVETQGADQHNYWVKSYQVQFSVNGDSWTTVSQVCRDDNIHLLMHTAIIAIKEIVMYYIRIKQK